MNWTSRIALIAAMGLGLTACGQSENADVSGLVGQAEEAARDIMPAAGNDQDALKALGLAEGASDALSFSKVSGGAFEGVTLSLSDEATLNAEKVTVSGARMENDQPVFDTLKFSGVTLPNDEAAIEIGSITISDPDPIVAQVVTALMNGQEPAEPTDDQLKNISLGLMEFSGVTLTIEDEEMPEPVVATIDGMSISGVKDGSIGDMSLKNFVLAGAADEVGPFELKLESFNMKGMLFKQFTAMPAYLEEIEELEEMGDEANPAMLKMPAAMVPTPDEMVNQSTLMKGFSFTGGGASAKIDEIKSDVERKGETIIQTQTLDGFVIEQNGPGILGGGLGMALGTLGYQKVEGSMDSVSTIDMAADTMDSQSVIKLVDAADLSFDVNVGGYASLIQQAAADPQGEVSMENLSFNSFGIALADNGLLERGLTLAQQFGMGSKDEIVAQVSMFAMMGAMQAETDAQRALLQDAQNALVEFINDGGELSIQIDAKEPLRIGDFADADPEALQARFGDDPLNAFDVKVSRQ